MLGKNVCVYFVNHITIVVINDLDECKVDLLSEDENPVGVDLIARMLNREGENPSQKYDTEDDISQRVHIGTPHTITQSG